MKLLAVMVISAAARHEHPRVLHGAACAHRMWMRLGAFTVQVFPYPASISMPQACRTAKCGLSAGILQGRIIRVTFKSRELFRPGKGVFTAGTATKHGRSEFSVTTLTNGRVMSVGGNAYLNGEFPVLETQKRWLPYEPFAAPVSN